MTDPTHSLSVLVVDDERDGAETLAMLLREFGHQVRTAHTPTEAIIARMGRDGPISLNTTWSAGTQLGF